LNNKYSYVRFRWLPATIVELEEAFSEFELVRRNMPTSFSEVSPYKRFRDYVAVKSDTLVVHASPFKAVMAQPKRQPFTKMDLALREIVIREYPKNTSSIFPWGFTREPPFTIAE
jgi:hypothetical protein